MNILALDTTTKFLCVGIYKDGAVYEYTIDAGRKMSLLITSTISRLLDAAGLDLEKIDYFACGLGPGSFTGIRLGLSTIKGLSFSSRAPVIGIPTLEIIAENATDQNACILTLVDAKRDLVYRGFYRSSCGRIRRLEPDRLIPLAEALKKIKNNVIITGDGAGLHKDAIFKKAPGAVILDKDCWYPKGHAIIKLALEKIKEKKTAKKCAPIYLYPKECQVRGTNVTGK